MTESGAQRLAVRVQVGTGRRSSAYSPKDHAVMEHVMSDRTATAHKQWQRTGFSLPST